MTKSSFDIPFPCLLAQPTARRPTMQTPLQPGPKVIFCVRGAISPLLSNLYLTEVDRMLEQAKETTRYGKYTYIEYARFADDLVILIDAHPRHDWLMGAVEKRLREELAKLQVEINEEKSRNVDLGRGESFGFLGFDFRRVRSRRGVWCAQYTPKLKKRTALLRKLKDVFRRYQSQPLGRVIKLINPMLRGWVAYFAVGIIGETFSFKNHNKPMRNAQLAQDGQRRDRVGRCHNGAEHKGDGKRHAQQPVRHCCNRTGGE